MTRRQLEKLLEEVRAMADSPTGLHHGDVTPIAKRLGRVRVVGRHPTWRRKGWPPLPIPEHSTALTRGTAQSILEQLEDDIVRRLSTREYEDE